MPKHLKVVCLGGYVKYGRQKSINLMQKGGHLYRFFQRFTTFSELNEIAKIGKRHE
jgi:hypothetical protein